MNLLIFSSFFFAQAAWVLIKQNAEYKPLQFLTFVFVYRIFEKLKAFEPPVSPTFTVSGPKSTHEIPSHFSVWISRECLLEHIY